MSRSYPNAHFAQVERAIFGKSSRRNRQASCAPNLELAKHQDKRDGLHPVRAQGIHPLAEAEPIRVSALAVETPPRNRVLAGDWDRFNGTRKLRGWDAVIAGGPR
jgi:hypothetical protein